jgi:hypothetical protein
MTAATHWKDQGNFDVVNFAIVNYQLSYDSIGMLQFKIQFGMYLLLSCSKSIAESSSTNDFMTYWWRLDLVVQSSLTVQQEINDWC